MSEAPMQGPVKRKRLFFVDYIRGWAIIGMVAAHFVDIFCRRDVLERYHGESMFFVLTFAAGLFFGIVGVSSALQMGPNRDADRRKRLAARGALLFAAGFLWTLMLRAPAQVDFLHCIGAAMIVCAALGTWERGWLVGLSLAPACWGLVALQQVSDPIARLFVGSGMISGDDLADPRGPLGFLLNAVTRSGHFPLHGWLPVIFVGYALGTAMVRSGGEWTARLRPWPWLAGVGLLAVALGLGAQGWGLTKIPISVGYSVMTCGVFCLFWALCALLEGVSERVPLGQWTVALGLFALPATALHWLIGRVILPRAHLTGNMGPVEFVTATAAILVLMVLLYKPWLKLVAAWSATPSAFVRSWAFLIGVSAVLYAAAYWALYGTGFRFHETASAFLACAGILIMCLPLYERRTG